LKRYLQVQGINGPVMIVSGLAAVWNLFAAWLFIDAFSLGFIGGPIVRISYFLFYFSCFLKTNQQNKTKQNKTK